jgi:hypothetical protein
MDISAKSSGVNREVVRGDPSFSSVNTSGSYTDYAFNMNATAVFPSAIVYGTWDTYLNVSFTLVLPADVSNFSGHLVEAYIHSGPIVSGVPTGAYPVFWFYRYTNSGIIVKGVPMGGAGVGSWNVTMFGVPPPEPFFEVGKSHAWLSFTSQAEMQLSIFLHGDGNLTYGNGSAYPYTLLTLFNFQRNTTVYYFGYPIAAYLGYGSSILIGAASLYYLISAATSRQNKKEIGKQRGGEA